MLFSTSVFLFGFLPIVLFFNYVLFKKSRKLQNIFLTIASLFFYAWGEPSFVIVMFGSIIGNWAFALWISKVRENRKQVRIAMTMMVAANLGILFIFKYLMFTVKNINLIFNSEIFIPNIVLPIGISFFTFQAMSYVIDVYRKHGEVQKNPLNVALYVAFFPQLIAGPIVRYETVADQIKNRTETFSDFAEGVSRFAVGLMKKMLLANTLAVVADKSFAADSPSVMFAWLGALAYTFQIYYDFSGYSDMGIGLGKMFGFHFLENFDYPYISKSITEFWRRWHMSLGTWFRDYVYFPLGGSRVDSQKRLVFNLFVVWFLTGLWHGANWTFLVWGLMYFGLITIEKVTGFDKKIGIFGHFYTLLFVIAGWVIFKADSLTAAGIYLGNMVGIGSNGFIDAYAKFYLKENMFFFAGALLFSFPIAGYINSKLGKSKIFGFFYPIVITAFFFLALTYVIKGSYNPFIYFNF